MRRGYGLAYFIGGKIMNTKRRSYDIYDIEERLHQLEKSGSSPASSGKYERVELFKSATAVTSNITLSDNFDNYDQIEIVHGFTGTSDKARRSDIFDATWFKNTFAYSTSNADPHFLAQIWSNIGGSITSGETTKALNVHNVNGAWGVLAVYGINYTEKPATTTKSTKRSSKK